MSEVFRYFERRAAEERLATMRSAHIKVRAVHLELAQRYQARADEIARRPLKVWLDVAGAA